MTQVRHNATILSSLWARHGRIGGIALEQKDASATGATGVVVRHLNPDELIKNPAFTNVVVVEGPVRTVYVGGLDAVDAEGNVVGRGDIGAQTEQVLKNLRVALAAAGAELHHVIKWNIYMVHGQPIAPGFQAFLRAWGDRPNPPAITGVQVAALANPDFLVEIDAVAVVPLG